MRLFGEIHLAIWRNTFLFGQKYKVSNYPESSSAANYNGPGVEWKILRNEEGAFGLVALVEGRVFTIMNILGMLCYRWHTFIVHDIPLYMKCMVNYGTLYIKHYCKVGMIFYEMVIFMHITLCCGFKE